jgi:hypothetical protein
VRKVVVFPCPVRLVQLYGPFNVETRKLVLRELISANVRAGYEISKSSEVGDAIVRSSVESLQRAYDSPLLCDVDPIYSFSEEKIIRPITLIARDLATFNADYFLNQFETHRHEPSITIQLFVVVVLSSQYQKIDDGTIKNAMNQAQRLVTECSFLIQEYVLKGPEGGNARQMKSTRQLWERYWRDPQDTMKLVLCHPEYSQSIDKLFSMEEIQEEIGYVHVRDDGQQKSILETMGMTSVSYANYVRMKV